MSQLVEVSHISRRRSSLRTTIPKKIQEKLGIKEENIIGYYEENGRIFLKRWNELWLIAVTSHHTRNPEL